MNASGQILGHLTVMDTKPMDKASGRKDIPPERLYILKVFAARAGAELERKLAEDALKQTAYAADAANHAKSEFLSRMSHELRTPLNAILGFTQVMNRNPSLSPEAQEHLGIISRSAEPLLVLINVILEMSKIESGIVTLNETSFDLYYLLDTLKAMFQLKAKFKDIELIFDIAPDVPQYFITPIANRKHE